MKRPRHWLGEALSRLVELIARIVGCNIGDIIDCNIGNIFGVAVDIPGIVEISGDIVEDCGDIVGHGMLHGTSSRHMLIIAWIVLADCASLRVFAGDHFHLFSCSHTTLHITPHCLPHHTAYHITLPTTHHTRMH